MKLEEKIKRKLISCVNYAQYSMNDNLYNMITTHHYTLNSNFINELLVECIRLKFYESVNIILKISLEFNIHINWLTLCIKMLEGSINLREPFYLSHISSDYQSQKLIFQTALENHNLNFHVYNKMFIISLIHLDVTLVEFFLADKLFINEILNQPRYKINHFCAKKLIIEYAIKQSNYVLFVKFFNNSSAEWLKSNAFHFLYLSAKYKQFNCSTNIISLIDVNALFENNFSSLEGVFKPSFCNFSQHIPNHSQIN